MKIMIIGWSGAGKSTLAKKLSDGDTPILHIDKFAYVDGAMQSKENIMQIISEFIRGNNSWIIEGNWANYLFEERCESADKILFLDFSYLTCFYGVWQRSKERKGEIKTEDGAPVKFNFEMVKVIFSQRRMYKQIYYGPHQNNDKLSGRLQLYKNKLVALKNREQVEKYLIEKNRRTPG
jgi:adenylate kinase family enzyme